MEQGKVVTPVIEINEKVKPVAPTKQNNLKSELPGGRINKQRYVVRRIIQHSRFNVIRNKKNNKA